PRRPAAGDLVPGERAPRGAGPRAPRRLRPARRRGGARAGRDRRRRHAGDRRLRARLVGARRRGRERGLRVHLAVLGGRGVSRRVALRHRTPYRFARPVTIYPHTIRLRPAPHTPATISGYSLTVDPGEHHITWHQDPFGGWAARLFFPGPSDHLELTVDLVTDLTPVNPFDFVVEDWGSTVPFTWPEPLRGDLGPYLTPVDDGPDADLVTDWLERRRPRPGTPIIDFLVELNRAVRADVDHRTR